MSASPQPSTSLLTPPPYQAGKNAARRGQSLDDVPGHYTDAQADAWERGWYSAMDAQS